MIPPPEGYFDAIVPVFATIIFLRFCRHRLTEVVCWGLSFVFTGLAFVWLRYFYVLKAMG